MRDTSRTFEAAAGLFDRSRPDYPEEAVDLLVRLLGLHAGRILLDLGAGTGKLSRLAAARGATVVALEPAAAMIRQAVGPGVLAVRAVAEALPIRRHGADAVCAASAFHWFDGRRALGEMHRVLRRGGRLALLWNQRDDRVPWVAALSALVDRREEGWPRYRSGAWRAAFDGARDLFRPLEDAHFHHVHELSPEGVEDRIASVSFLAVLPEAERAAIRAEVRALLAAHPETAGKAELRLPYRTDVFTWERVGQRSGLGYLYWYRALERIEPSRVAALLYLEPLVTLAAAVVLIAEPVGVITVAGGALVVGGVALVQRA